jgi:hypothetical protein
MMPTHVIGEAQLPLLHRLMLSTGTGTGRNMYPHKLTRP